MVLVLSIALGTVHGIRHCPRCWVLSTVLSAGRGARALAAVPGAAHSSGALSAVLSAVRGAGLCPRCWALSAVLGHCL